MADANDKDAHAHGDKGSKTETLIAAAELERRKYESGKRLAQLQQEQLMLQEIRDSLEEQERTVGRQLATAQGDHDRISEKIDDMTRGLAHTERQIEEHRREISVLKRRCSDNERLQKKLLKDIAAVEKLVGDDRNTIFSVGEELEMGRALLARMDQRLALRKTKRRAVSET